MLPHGGFRRIPCTSADLAIFLPGFVTSGVLLLRRHRFGYATTVGQIGWLALTCLPILATPFIANARGHEPGWAVLVPIGVVFVGPSAGRYPPRRACISVISRCWASTMRWASWRASAFCPSLNSVLAIVTAP